MLEATEYAKAVLPEQEAQHGYYLDKARAAAISIARDKRDVVTIDDVWDICPPPKGIDPRILGGVFRALKGDAFQWKCLGYQKSRRSAANHGRPVGVWKLVEGQ